MPSGYAYILGSDSRTLYIGVTSKFSLRIWQHKNGAFEGFSKTYNCTRLLYYERFEDIRRLSVARNNLRAGVGKRS